MDKHNKGRLIMNEKIVMLLENMVKLGNNRLKVLPINNPTSIYTDRKFQ